MEPVAVRTRGATSVRGGLAAILGLLQSRSTVRPSHLACLDAALALSSPLSAGARSPVDWLESLIEALHKDADPAERTAARAGAPVHAASFLGSVLTHFTPLFDVGRVISPCALLLFGPEYHRFFCAVGVGKRYRLSVWTAAQVEACDSVTCSWQLCSRIGGCFCWHSGWLLCCLFGERIGLVGLSSLPVNQ